MWRVKNGVDKIWHIEMQPCGCRKEYEVEAEVEAERKCQGKKKKQSSCERGSRVTDTVGM